MLTLIAALKEELAGLKQRMTVEDTVAENGYQIFHSRQGGKETLLVQTGTGRERAERAVRFVLEHYPARAIISFGFAGGLTPELSVGEIILCSTLCCNDGPSDSCRPDADLFSRSLQICDGSITHQGKSVTVARPAPQPEVKRALAQAFQADVVDMESYWIARIANEKGVPFLAVRAVSDTVQERLPPVERMLGSNGEPDLRKIVFYSLFHPRQLVTLTRLHRNSRIARENLTTFLSQLMERF